MAIENGIITGAVSISEVQQVLGATSSDLGTLCTHENINIWAYNKPVRDSDPFASMKGNGWQQGKGSQDGYLDDTTCGLLVGNAHQTLFGGAQAIRDKVVDISKDTNGFLYKLTKGLTGNWAYQRPEGASKGSWYRLDDFRGYNHNAVNPMPSVQMPTDGIYRYQSGIFNSALNVPTISLENSLTNVTLDALQLPSSMVGVTLRNMYFGVLLYTDDLTDVMWATQTAEQKNKGLNQVTFLDNDYITISNRKGMYNARAFFCTQTLECNNYNQPSGTIAFLLPSVDTPIKVAVLDANLPMVELIAGNKIISNSYYPQVTITNNMPYAVTVSSVVFNNGLNLALDSTTPVPQTIVAFGHAVFRAALGAGFAQSFTVTAIVDNETYTASANATQIISE